MAVALLVWVAWIIKKAYSIQNTEYRRGEDEERRQKTVFWIRRSVAEKYSIPLVPVYGNSGICFLYIPDSWIHRLCKKHFPVAKGGYFYVSCLKELVERLRSFDRGEAPLKGDPSFDRVTTAQQVLNKLI